MKLPFDVKWVIYALIALVVLVLVYYVWKKLTTIEDVAASNKAIAQANKEIDTNTLTITDEQAESLAEKFYDAIIGPGTDIDAIWDAIGYCKTRSDVIKVAATYNLKYKDSWLSSGSLWQDLRDDLSASEIKKFNQILEYKNVAFTI